MDKKKDAAQSDASAEKEDAVTVGETQTETPDVSGDAGEDLSERDKLYAKYKPEGNPEGSNQESVEKDADAPAESEEGEPEKKKDDTEDSKDDKSDKPEEKTVPHGAFHEERERRKELQAEVLDLKNQLRDVINERKPEEKDKEEEEYIEDYDAELLKQRKRADDLEAQIASLKQKDSQTDAQKMQTAFLENVRTTHKELAEEGFDGFEKCTPLIKQHIQDLIMKEPDPQSYFPDSNGAVRKVLDIDNSVGWKKIYKEEIYPSMQKIIDQKDKDTLIDERIALKKKAALSGNSGGKPVVKKKEDVNSLSQKEMNSRYMEMREKEKQRSAV
tara:strand:- start:10034 stop:11023 length:990 start_codon:yes stop_codon:yes gene_type:complete